jgi:hypothetical protein
MAWYLVKHRDFTFTYLLIYVTLFFLTSSVIKSLHSVLVHPTLSAVFYSDRVMYNA